MRDLIYSVSLLFGILIILLIIVYYDLLININKAKGNDNDNGNDDNIVEKYRDYGEYIYDDLKEQEMTAKNIIMTSDDIKAGDENYKHVIYENNIVDKYKISRLLKSPSLKMLISSFEKDNHGNIQHFQWNKDNEVNEYNNNGRDFVVSIDDSPKIHRFPFNPIIYGYNLSNITVEIDNKKNSKDSSENEIINELAVFFNLKLNDIKCNSGTGTSASGQFICINSYDYQNIYINIVENNKVRCKEGESINIDDNYGTLNDIYGCYANDIYRKKTYDIVLDINSNKYYIKDISEDILKDSVIFMGLIINKDRIAFYINKEVATFERLDDKLIIIDYPIYINKNKECDITLYSAALFINSNNIQGDMEKYELYNKYNLYDKINI
jgi:hypothetical protein